MDQNEQMRTQADEIEQILSSKRPQEDGVLTRVQQENSRLSKTLSSLGIDPNSEVIDDIVNGKITKEELVGYMQGGQPAVDNQPPAPTKQELNRAQEIIESLKSKDVITKDDFISALETLTSEVSETKSVTSKLRQQQEEEELASTYNDCMEAVKRNVPVIPGASQELQNIMKETLWALTNELAVTEGQKVGNTSAYMNPASYNILAAKAAENLKAMFKHQSQAGGPKPVPGDNVITLGNGDGGGSYQANSPRVTRSNMDAVARAYAQQMANERI